MNDWTPFELLDFLKNFDSKLCSLLKHEGCRYWIHDFCGFNTTACTPSNLVHDVLETGFLPFSVSRTGKNLRKTDSLS